LNPVRTRFAPSPTGYLHVGGVRTALFSWLYAKHFQGEFILRIEDTDKVRSTSESVAAIIDGMAWLELEANEGPIYQSQRFDRYETVVQELIQKGFAYRCNCSVERLEKVREEQMAKGEKPRYDGHCRDKDISTDKPFVIRFKTPKEGEVHFHDLVYGEITVANHELDDLVLVRTDGVPTYNFAVVIDDWDMNITHVIRGDDHINNTPRQIHLYQALKAPIPIFAHLPMILGPDGKRLSKRHGAVSIMSFREEGYLPQALLNYLVRLGWSHGDQEIFSIEEMIKDFNLEHVSRSACSFDYDKLRWLNQHYMKTLAPEDTKVEWLWHMRNQQLDMTQGPSWEALAPLQTPRYKTMKELVEQSHYFYEDVEPNYSELEAFRNQALDNALNELIIELTQLKDWNANMINSAIKAILQVHGLKMPQLAQPLRLLVSATLTTPSIDVTLELIGRQRVLERLKRYFR
jgi:glutamyl-tRNA synthetase